MIRERESSCYNPLYTSFPLMIFLRMGKSKLLMLKTFVYSKFNRFNVWIFLNWKVAHFASNTFFVFISKSVHWNITKVLTDLGYRSTIQISSMSIAWHGQAFSISAWSLIGVNESDTSVTRSFWTLRTILCFAYRISANIVNSDNLFLGLKIPNRKLSVSSQSQTFSFGFIIEKETIQWKTYSIS